MRFSPLKGFRGVASHLSEASSVYLFLFLVRRQWGLGFLKDVRLACGSSGYEFDTNRFDEELPLTDGSSILIKNAVSIDELSINDIFVTIDQLKPPPLLPIKDGWNRYNCQTTQSKISLYFRHSASTAEFQYPSATISCENTFKALKSPLQTFTVRCPRFCVSPHRCFLLNSTFLVTQFKAFAPVIGLFSYSVCQFLYY